METTKTTRVMSKWRVSSSYYDGEKEYKVYRLRDVNATDHSGNRELYDTTIYKTRAEAKAVADALNVIEYCENNTTMSIYELAGEVEKKADVMETGAKSE